MGHEAATLDRQTVRYYRRFRGGTGCIGRDAEVSLRWARALVSADENGWRFGWETDEEDMASGDWDGHCDECGVCGAHRASHVSEVCILRDENGAVLETIGAVWDADESYRRIIEAELASEALAC